MQQVSCLCLPSAFNTFDHSIILHRLSTWFGLSSVSMVHFLSLIPHIYCRDIFTQFSFIPSYIRSSPRLRSRPTSFKLYTTPLGSLISVSPISHLLYADDTQLFISFISDNFSSIINNLLSTITFISSWMSSNYLTHSPPKTEFLLIGLPQQTFKIVNPSLPPSLPPNP